MPVVTRIIGEGSGTSVQTPGSLLFAPIDAPIVKFPSLPSSCVINPGTPLRVWMTGASGFFPPNSNLQKLAIAPDASVLTSESVGMGRLADVSVCTPSLKLNAVNWIGASFRLGSKMDESSIVPNTKSLVVYGDVAVVKGLPAYL